MPYPNEHSCRILDPDKFKEMRRNNCEQKHEGKCIDVIYGITGAGEDRKSEIQTLRYPVDVWTEASAKAHCEERKGFFESAVEEKKEEIKIPLYPKPFLPMRSSIPTYPSPSISRLFSGKRIEEEKKEEMGAREVNIREEASCFQEAEFDDKERNVIATIIASGWSKNGNYWDKKILERELVPLLKERRKMYLNHPGPDERGVRDLSKWTGTIEEPIYEDGKIKSRIHVLNNHNGWIYDASKREPNEVGVSVNVRALVEAGEREGKSGDIVKRVVGFESADFVTQASAGGKVEAIQEEWEDKNMSGGEKGMEFKDLTVEGILRERPEILKPYYEAIEKLEAVNKELEKKIEGQGEDAKKFQEKVEGLEKKIKEAERKISETEEEKVKEENKKKIKEMLDKSGLPEATKNRVIQGLNKGNYKDEKELKEAIEKSISSEKDYLQAITGKEPIVKNLGEGNDKDEMQKGVKHLQELSKRMDERMGVLVQEEKEEKE